MAVNAMSWHFRQLPFWERVTLQTELRGECHIFTGHTDECGYGRIHNGRKLVRLHRATWEREHGQIEPGMEVCHECDTPACINPDHLFLGTHKENIEDCVRKGRNQRGSQKYNAKLTEDTVRAIKAAMARGATNAALGREHGISACCMSRIRHGIKWKHVA